MKYIITLSVFLVFTSCTRFLIGEKKLTYKESTPYIKSAKSHIYSDDKFYIIPFEDLKGCRGYPKILYIGSENNYSFFGFEVELKYKDEITLIALPDSSCINKYPSTMDGRNISNRRVKIVDNKMVVADTIIQHIP